MRVFLCLPVEWLTSVGEKKKEEEKNKGEINKNKKNKKTKKTSKNKAKTKKIPGNYDFFVNPFDWL